MARYYLETYGCTANRGESRAIEQSLRDAGHHAVDQATAADVGILNSCTVVQTTEDRMLRRAEELQHTTDDLIITGCMALAQESAFTDAGINAQILHWDAVPPAVTNGECPTPTSDSAPVLDGKIGILPIARGCMSDCSYCITKQATGKIDSPPVAENVEKASALIHAGAAELRVTGQDTGVYGWDTGERKLHELLDEICHLPGDFRVRVGMANPKGIHGIRDELAHVFATHDNLYNFLHIPVQSGSDAVLGDMRRQHQVSEFLDVIDTFDAYLDDWTLSTDFIVGFPTETDADHEQSKQLLNRVKPEKTNITRFSKRPGTDAASLDGLGGTLKKERSKELSALKRDIVRDVYDSLVGSIAQDVLVVEPGTGSSVKCRDLAYRQIIIKNADEHAVSPGDVIDIEITDHNTMYAIGTPC